MLKRYLSSLLIVLLMALAQSCSPLTEILLYNNTERPIVVQFKGTRVSVNEGAVAQLYHHQLAPKFVITIGDEKLNYRMAYPPKLYVKPKLMGFEIHFQIEPDGSIYVLKPEVAMPVPQLEVQPDGFPLKPL